MVVRREAVVRWCWGRVVVWAGVEVVIKVGWILTTPWGLSRAMVGLPCPSSLVSFQLLIVAPSMISWCTAPTSLAAFWYRYGLVRPNSGSIGAIDARHGVKTFARRI